MDISNAQSSLNSYGFLYKLEGPDSASVVVDQFPKAGISVDKNHPITLKIGKGDNPEDAKTIVKGLMPDLRGLTLRKAVDAAAREGLEVRINGSGIVRKQSLLPGSRISKNSVCILEASL